MALLVLFMAPLAPFLAQFCEIPGITTRSPNKSVQQRPHNFCKTRESCRNTRCVREAGTVSRKGGNDFGRGFVSG